MARTLQQPLDESDLARIDTTLNDIDELEKAINKAKRAGINVEGRIEEVRNARNKLNAIKREYGNR